MNKLRQVIASVTYLDENDPVAAFRDDVASLERRREILTSLDLAEIQFSGPDLDLRVGLSRASIWRGAQKPTASGIMHVANIPVGELFTTPDWRTANGKARLTKPVKIGGDLISDVVLYFKDGEIYKVDAGRYQSQVENHLKLHSLDPAHIRMRRLGELALASMDSRVAKSGVLFFGEVLMDEKAGCHVADGEAYLSCVEAPEIIPGTTPSREVLDLYGINYPCPLLHWDLIISDERTTAIGKSHSQRFHELIAAGLWGRALVI